MSSARIRLALRWTILSATLGAAWPARVDAQLAQVYRQRLGSEYQRVIVRRRADSVEAARLRSLHGDTARSGAVTVVGVAQLGPLAHTVAGVADSILRRRLVTEADVPGGRVFRLRPDSGEQAAAEGRIPRIRVSIYLDITRREKTKTVTQTSAASWWAPAPVIEVAQRIASELVEVAGHQLPTAFLAWLQTTPSDTAAPLLWSETYLHLATSPNLTARRCLVGDLEGCRLAVRLGTTADPLRDWLTPETRRAIVASSGFRHRNGPPDDDRLCVDERKEDACLAILRRDIPNAADEPLRGRYGQTSLTITALGMPGAPGYAAIRGRSGLEPTAALEAIAGAPLHDILRQWRSRVLSARTETVVLEPRELLASAGWVLLLGLASLKGTRWR